MEVKNILAVDSSIGWRDFIGGDGDMLTINHYGESGGGQKSAKTLGFSPENIAEKFKQMKEKNER